MQGGEGSDGNQREQADGEPNAQSWAVAAGTINYEIVTRMAPRAARTYVGEGAS